MAIPPIMSPIPLMVSETATAFKPPRIANNEPNPPINTTIRMIASNLDTFKIVETSKILSKFSAPVYNTIGNSVVTYNSKNNPETIMRVDLSNRTSKNSVMVTNPILRYLGKKKSAIATIANAAKVSQAITSIPYR